MTATSTPGRLCPICGAETDAAVCPTDDVPTIRADLGEPRPDEALGAVIAGRFRVDRLIGEGASGRVYAATQLSVGRSVALKLLQHHRRPDRNEIRRFYREARAATRLASEHVVRVFDFGVDDIQQVPFIAMELIEGETLRDLLLRERALVPGLVAALGAQIASALAEAAEAQLVHRDLKPANILVRSDPHAGLRVKVGDFGVAKDLAREDTESLTAHGAAIGTPGYMSPEQLSGKPVGPASDLYALGCILFEALTGARPFIGEGRAALMMDHLLSPPPPLPDPLPSGASAPTAFAELIGALLAKDPGVRPASAREVARRLAAMADASALPFSTTAELAPDVVPPPPSPGPRATETGAAVVAELPSPPTEDVRIGKSSRIRPRLIGLAGVVVVAGLVVALPYLSPASTPSAEQASPMSGPATSAAAAPMPGPTAAAMPGPMPAMFDQLVVRGGSARVVLHHGPPRPMRVDGDPTRVIATLEGPALSLAFTSPEATDPAAPASPPPEVHLWSLSWRRLQIAGSSTVVSAAPLPIIDLSLALGGSARAELALVGATLTTNIRGSCEAILSGKILHHEGRIGGAARLDSSRLETLSTSLTAAGTSEATVFAKELLDARNDSTGEITYLGNPKEITRAGTGIRAVAPSP